MCELIRLFYVSSTDTRVVQGRPFIAGIKIDLVAKISCAPRQND